MRSRLKTLSGLKERSPHWLMKRAIAEYLDREERHEREKREDMQRWQTYQESGTYIADQDMRTHLTTLADSARHKADVAE